MTPDTYVYITTRGVTNSGQWEEDYSVQVFFSLTYIDFAAGIVERSCLLLAIESSSGFIPYVHDTRHVRLYHNSWSNKFWSVGGRLFSAGFFFLDLYRLCFGHCGEKLPSSGHSKLGRIPQLSS